AGTQSVCLPAARCCCWPWCWDNKIGIANNMMLVILLLIPFIAGLVCWQTTRTDGDRGTTRWIALIATLLMLILSMLLWLFGNFSLDTLGAPQWQYEIRLAWIDRLGISFHLALDGLSIIMVALNSFLGVFAVLCSWKEISD